MQPIYYIAAGFEWSAGDTVSNEMFPDAPRKTFFVPAIPAEHADNPDYLARRTTELKLEELRARAYKGLPSRGDVVFLNRCEEDARKWLRRGSRRHYHIYELNPIRTEVAFETDYIWYNYLVRLHRNPLKENRKLFSKDIATEIAGCLSAYWTNRTTEAFQSTSEIEILFVGELNVRRKVIA
jgi:hypothetical protein